MSKFRFRSYDSDESKSLEDYSPVSLKTKASPDNIWLWVASSELKKVEGDVKVKIYQKKKRITTFKLNSESKKHNVTDLKPNTDYRCSWSWSIGNQTSKYSKEIHTPSRKETIDHSSTRPSDLSDDSEIEDIRPKSVKKKQSNAITDLDANTRIGLIITPAPKFFYVDLPDTEHKKIDGDIIVLIYDRELVVCNLKVSSRFPNWKTCDLKSNEPYHITWTYKLKNSNNTYKNSKNVSTTVLNPIHFDLNPDISNQANINPNSTLIGDLPGRIKYIKDLEIPEKSFHKFINILLIGRIGDGKSSYLNTIASILHGSYIKNALTGNQTTSFTTDISYRQITDYKGVPLCPNINFVDLFGLESEPVKYGALAEKLIQGKVKPGTSLDDFNKLTIINPLKDYNENSGKRTINGAVIVLAQQTVDSPEQMKNLEIVANILKKMQVPYNIALTQIDTLDNRYSPLPMNDVYCYPEVYDKIEQIIENYPSLGSANQIFPVTNYLGEYRASDYALEFMAMHVFYSTVKAAIFKIQNEINKTAFD